MCPCSFVQNLNSLFMTEELRKITLVYLLVYYLKYFFVSVIQNPKPKQIIMVTEVRITYFLKRASDFHYLFLLILLTFSFNREDASWVFDSTAKPLEIRQKHSAARRIFNYLPANLKVNILLCRFSDLCCEDSPFQPASC